MDFSELTAGPIDIASVARRVVPPECGATVTLDGYARRFTLDKATGETRETEYLEYEAYEEMARTEIRKLIVAAKEKFPISCVGIVHRLGRLEIGETSVVISVAAPHRRPAFEACDWLIRELKRTVPIFKKEVYAGGERWVEGDASDGERISGTLDQTVEMVLKLGVRTAKPRDHINSPFDIILPAGEIPIHCRVFDNVADITYLICKLHHLGAGTVIGVNEMPNLPPSVLATLNNDRTAGGSKPSIQTTILEIELPAGEMIVAGSQTLTFNVID